MDAILTIVLIAALLIGLPLAISANKQRNEAKATKRKEEFNNLVKGDKVRISYLGSDIDCEFWYSTAFDIVVNIEGDNVRVSRFDFIKKV